MANGSNMGGIPALSFLSGLGGGLIQAKQYANQLMAERANAAADIALKQAQGNWYNQRVGGQETVAGIRSSAQQGAAGLRSGATMFNALVNSGMAPADAYQQAHQWAAQNNLPYDDPSTGTQLPGQTPNAPVQVNPGGGVAPQNAPPVTQLPGQTPNAPVQVNPGGGVGSQVQPQSPVVNPGMTATLPLVAAKITNLGSKTNLNKTNSTYIAGPKTADTSASAAYTAGSKTLNTNADTGLKNQQATGQGLTNQTIIPKAKSQIRLQGAEGSALTSNASSNNLKANAAVTTAAAELSRAQSYANLTSAQVANYANVFGLDKQKFASAIQNRPELIKSTTQLILQATADKAKYNAAPAWSATNPNGMTSAARAAGLKAANDALYNNTQRLNRIVNSAGNPPPQATSNQQQPTPRAAPTSGAGMTTIGPGLTADASGNIYKNGQPTGHRLK